MGNAPLSGCNLERFFCSSLISLLSPENFQREHSRLSHAFYNCVDGLEKPLFFTAETVNFYAIFMPCTPCPTASLKLRINYHIIPCMIPVNTQKMRKMSKNVMIVCMPP
jgi:hypothetical protein